MTMCLSTLAKAGFFSQITQGLTWKETHDEVTAAAMYMKDTLAAEGFQQTISCLIDRHGMVEKNRGEVALPSARPVVPEMTAECGEANSSGTWAL
ncbi:hypothetical protein HID58_018863 [Brassica napus]|uniref:Uncharacterized protein n=1 Tax=Brassica napus TaxID=3708 RepID=A0ABQ8DB33_BRANA|nr:hypothetical protein HID58_018863 [Brassica napus]